jgi:hypothetical protein
MNRRDAIKGLGGLAALASLGTVGVATEPWERLTHALRPASPIDTTTIDHLEDVTLSLSRLERTAGAPATLLPAVVGHMDTLVGFLSGGRRLDSAGRRRLCSLAGETAALAGWLAWDLNDQARADHYFRSGLEAAQEAGDSALGAYLLGGLGHAPMVREDPNARLARLTGRAFGFVAADASPHTRAWLAILEAQAHALLGDGTRYDRLSAFAEEMLIRDDPGDVRRPRVPFIDRPYLAEAQAVSLLRLERPHQARETLANVLPAVPARMWLWMLTDLAEACAAEGEPEQAARYAMQALDGASAARLGPILESLRGLSRRSLEPYSTVPAVREFMERMSGA